MDVRLAKHVRCGPLEAPSRWATLLVMSSIVFSPLAANAKQARELLICVENPIGQRESGKRLARLIPGVPIRLVDSRRCPKRAARFIARGGKVVIQLGKVHRPVPWIKKPRAALARLTARRRLSEFSLLMSGMLAETRWLDTRRSRPIPTPKPLRREETPRKPQKPPAKQISALPAKQISATRPVKTNAKTNGPASRPTKPRSRTTSRRLANVTSHSKRAKPAPKLGQKGRPKEAQRDEPGMATMLSKSRKSSWHVEVGAIVLARVRSTGSTALRLGIQLALMRFFLTVDYQLPSRWTLDERQLELEGLGFTLGYSPVLWRLAALRFQGVVGGRLEYLSAARQDISSAKARTFWDVGLVAGAVVSWRALGWLDIGAVLQASVFPLGREVAIPNGPSAAANLVSFDSGIRIVLLP
jgi:hypothetical protein